MSIVFIPTNKSHDGRQMYEPHLKGDVPQRKKPANIRIETDPDSMISRLRRLLNRETFLGGDLSDHDFSGRRRP